MPANPDSNRPAADKTQAECDVLIVGLGPVGAALANLLGRYGIHTLAIDRSPEIFMAPRAIALDNEALRVLQLAGLPEGAFETLAIPNVRMHSPQAGQFGSINTAGSIDGHPKLVTFYQPDLERALRKRMTEYDCVNTMLGHELLDLMEDSAGVAATLQGPEGNRFAVRCRFLVAADGASSRIRQLIGQDFAGQTYAQDWLIVDAVRPGPLPDHIEFRCDPARPAPHMPAPGGRERWEFMLRPGETREQMESDESIRALLAPWGDAAAMQIERRAVYRFHARVAAHFRKGRVFLAGDAAHITPPFVGQGLVAGLRDAANLGWKLAWVVKGHASPQILDSYDTERRPHACAMINLARLMGGLVMPTGAMTAMFVHGLLRQLRRIPPLRRYFDELGIKPKNRFKAGLFVRGHGGSRLVRGGVLPQGWVRDHRGTICLSDEVLGPALTLIGFGGDARDRLCPEDVNAFVAAGGSFVQIVPRGLRGPSPAQARFCEDLDGRFIPDLVRPGWCAVVRPDRVVLLDGPIEDAGRVVRECLRLLGAPDGTALTPVSNLSPAST